jgi:prepilin-type N-terminal cleavage/methylation domain-containing protein
VKNRLYKNSREKGFTLIEIMISLAIFTVVAVIAVGSLLKVMDLNRKSVNLKTAINNLNFVLESMSREIRMGTKYKCGSNVDDLIDTDYYSNNTFANICYFTNVDKWIFIFTSSEKSADGMCNLVYAYKYKSGVIEKAQQNLCGQNLQSSDFSALTSSNMAITKSTMNNNIKNTIVISLYGTVGVKDKEKVDFTIKTRATQRLKSD